MNKEIISILNKDKREILNHHDLLFKHSFSIKRIENILIFIVIFSIVIMVFFYFYKSKKESCPPLISQNH